MTGLDPTRDVIVEIATIVTDDDLTIIAEGPDLVVHQPDVALAAMDPIVVEMHTRSGLLDAIRASTVALDEAGDATLEFIKSHVPAPRSVPLCGNSIGTDRRFLAAYLPAIEEHLHYRSIDVSSVKELVRRWYPKIGHARPAEGRHPPGAGRHPGQHRGAALLPGAGVHRPRTVAPSPVERDAPRGRRLTCAAVVLHQHGGPEVLTVEDVAPPEPGPDEVLVDVHHTAINRADVLQRMGLYPDPRRTALGGPRTRVRRRRACRRGPGHRVVAGRSRHGHRDGRVLRRAADDPRPPGAAHPGGAWSSPTRPPCPRCS